MLPLSDSNSLVAVTLSWREHGDTIALLRALDDGGECSLIVVVENESAGDIETLLDAEVWATPIVLLTNPQNRGFAAGMNLGLAYALRLYPEGRFLCINNDVVLKQDAIPRLLTALEARVGIAAPAIRELPGREVVLGSRFNRARMRVTSCRSRVDAANSLSWACVLVDHSVFGQIGLLNEKFFMYWEDVEFSLRAVEAGFPLLVVEEAMVEHRTSSSGRQAGSRLEYYSSLGLVQLALGMGGRAVFFAFLRLGVRTVRACFRRQWALVKLLVGVPKDSLELSRGEIFARDLLEQKGLTSRTDRDASVRWWRPMPDHV